MKQTDRHSHREGRKQRDREIQKDTVIEREGNRETDIAIEREGNRETERYRQSLRHRRLREKLPENVANVMKRRR